MWAHSRDHSKATEVLKKLVFSEVWKYQRGFHLPLKPREQRVEGESHRYCKVKLVFGGCCKDIPHA